MAEPVKDDDLNPEQTPGFKVGEKKTIDEYQQLDAQDESLRKWKESLGLATGKDLSDPSDPRTCIILALTLETADRPPIVIDLSQPGQVEKLRSEPFTIKENAQFHLKIKFKVQHQILSGLKLIQKFTRMGLSHGQQEMIGSYAPNTADKPFYEVSFAEQDAPGGLMGRGKYNATAKFVDDDKVQHLMFEWSFEVKKDW
ncbi:Rho GDP-dissociation inhibitor 2 [Trichodelitschia bisporula]|uniref:Rho GDP-dissociation inhibitor n=1 Tax=Trichodelitschia bisporula TaxID=703511 RepID=A0A6G1HLB8_9PEZI|nr:Rho GDP-dissociation inhibitor 2 [Trichodelitschia bisporula]